MPSNNSKKSKKSFKHSNTVIERQEPTQALVTVEDNVNSPKPSLVSKSKRLSIAERELRDKILQITKKKVKEFTSMGKTTELYKIVLIDNLGVRLSMEKQAEKAQYP